MYGMFHGLMAAGIAEKAKGKQIGNRKRYFDKQKASELRRQGWGQVRIAKALTHSGS